ncbi:MULTISPECIES: kelch motif-containing protein [unclassified Streptomyces]|uniref:kelch motif-containing protein n=1 Tax=unclassified Streptomyces TaxID=2593676 RepID=UPI002DDC624D|nr:MULTISPECIES: kelch motif-containing protein [unclassified Streptomyces]WSF86563.1 kelch motif-containing protein [Streptomyces sp. NBC_01744]WSC37166.1 kelch motif-containing protein [Streptomyces sp. NBC_01763]WSC45298.1 kelch motif-containing protein [Streptomyces sp. NBC_01762]WSC55716.1 kelch motif-containing protein [Streptomyces sp. NBC_01761]WSD24959.1 kelch motif-containing protein [Streptomyces sp. NBC_01751]
MKYRPSRRTRRMAISTAVVLALSGANGPWLYRFGSERYHAYTINKPEYKAANGHWDFLDVPSEFRINTIHAALLHTGKVLLVAGSGNNQKNFDAKSFRSVLWDPGANTFKNIPTPKDMFCSGHTQLPDGKLLIAGGTKRYEKLEGDVTKAGGLMIVHNENPDKPITLPAGTRFTGKGNGKTFVSKDPVLVEKATKVFDKRTGAFLRNDPGLGRIYVESQQAGTEYETGTQDNYRISGLSGSDTRNVYGIAQKLALDKKDFQGIREAYEFDPVAEKYITVDPMNEARWYPTLTTLEDGKVLALSGLDEIGQIVPGKDEIYDPKTRKWAYTGIVRKFPTYPAVFLLDDGKLFYSGSNAGYGPADIGRDPGIWDLATNRFKKIPGLSDADEMETSATVRLSPAQDEKFMVIGGGGVGESERSSEKSRLVDLKDPDPKFRNGASLDEGTRYPSASLLPDDSVLVTGGSDDYRGRGGSNILQARLYDAKTDSYKRVADPAVGRNYHSGSVLLPDGRVLIFGSDSLYADRADSRPGIFEQRIEIYTPPYLYRDSRPELTAGPKSMRRGGTGMFTTSQGSTITSAKLMRPSAVTHVTDTDQRSVELGLRRTAGGISVTVPKNRALVPSGWYMLFVTDAKGTPSEGKWVEIP